LFRSGWHRSLERVATGTRKTKALRVIFHACASVTGDFDFRNTR